MFKKEPSIKVTKFFVLARLPSLHYCYRLQFFIAIVFNCPFYAMFLIRITPFTYHNIDTVNLRRIRRSGLYFGSSLVVSYEVKQTN